MSDFITSITPLSGGSGMTAVTIICPEHTGREPRTATRRIKYNTMPIETLKTLTVTQIGKPEFVSIEFNELEKTSDNTFVLNGISNASELTLEMGDNESSEFFTGNESAVLTINGESEHKDFESIDGNLVGFYDIEYGKTEAYEFELVIQLTGDEIVRNEMLILKLNGETFILKFTNTMPPIINPDFDKDVEFLFQDGETERTQPIGSTNGFIIEDFNEVPEINEATGVTHGFSEEIQP